MVGMDDLNRRARQNPSMNRKGVFQFVSGLTRGQAEAKANNLGLQIVEGSFIGRGKQYRLIGYRRSR